MNENTSTIESFELKAEHPHNVGLDTRNAEYLAHDSITDLGIIGTDIFIGVGNAVLLALLVLFVVLTCVIGWKVGRWIGFRIAARLNRDALYYGDEDLIGEKVRVDPHSIDVDDEPTRPRRLRPSR